MIAVHERMKLTSILDSIDRGRYSGIMDGCTQKTLWHLVFQMRVVPEEIIDEFAVYMPMSREDDLYNPQLNPPLPGGKGGFNYRFNVNSMSRWRSLQGEEDPVSA